MRLMSYLAQLYPAQVERTAILLAPSREDVVWPPFEGVPEGRSCSRSWGSHRTVDDGDPCKYEERNDDTSARQ